MAFFRGLLITIVLCIAVHANEDAQEARASSEVALKKDIDELKAMVKSLTERAAEKDKPPHQKVARIGKESFQKVVNRTKKWKNNTMAMFKHIKEKDWKDFLEDIIAGLQQSNWIPSWETVGMTVLVLVVVTLAFPKLSSIINEGRISLYYLYIFPRIQELFIAALAMPSLMSAVLSFVSEYTKFGAFVGVFVFLVLVLGLYRYSYQDNRHMYSATVSFNFFTKSGSFTFKAWKELPLSDIRISDGEAHAYKWKTSHKNPFFDLGDPGPVADKIKKALGLQISELFSPQWTEHICGGVPYVFKDLVIGLIFEKNAKAGKGMGAILQWRIFVISEEDLIKCTEGEGEFDDEIFAWKGQNEDRYGKILLMKELFYKNTNSFCKISVPIRPKDPTLRDTVSKLLA